MYHRKNRNFPASFIITAFLGLFVSNLTIAQVKPPQITPLSPNAAALWKYAEFPVNMYTGIPSISIPLYEVKSGSLSVPISLSYHAGGNRYEDQASWVGLGWNLNAGGAVNRNVKGKADEKYGVGIFTQSQPLNTQLPSCDWTYFTEINKGNIDVQPDEFTYSMPGKGGRFAYKQTVAEPLIMPYAPIKITKTYSPDNLSAFQIIDDGGETYRFGNNKLLNNPVTESTSGGIGSSIEETMPYPGSWLLAEIESADATDVISFNYATGGAVQKNSKASSLTVSEQLPDFQAGQLGGPVSYGSVMDLNFSFLTNTKYLSEILFDNGKVEFVQTSWYRTDLYNNQRALEAINIYSKVDGAYILVKKVVFTYSYFKRKFHDVLQDWKLKLNKVQVFGKNSQIAEEYSFEYHTDNFSGDEYYFLPYALDYWGFYNDKTANTSLIPLQTFPAITDGHPIAVGNADRSVNPVYLTEGVLKKITYPTGGFSGFEYEPHQYSEDAILKLAGGLRINRITTTESATNGIVQEKVYKYGLNEQGDGFKNFYNNVDFYRSLVFNGPPATCNYSISSTQSFQLDGFDGTPVLYPYVTEYVGNTTTNNGKTKYVYDNGSPVQDNLVIAYEAFTNLFFRKTNHWKRGFLTQKTVFDKNNNKVSEQSSTYQIIHPVEELVGLYLQKKIFSQGDPNPPTGSCYATIYSGSPSYPTWHKAYMPFSTGAVKMTNATEKIYDLSDPSNSVTNVTNYVYDANYLQPLEVNKTLRKLQTGYEEQVIDYTKYPFSYSFTGAPSGSDALGIKLLQDKNIIAVPIEQYTVKKFKNPTTWQSDITAGTITTFRSDKPYPDKIYQIETAAPITSASFGSGSTIVSNAFSKNAAYKEKLAFTSYDAKGNITQYNKVNDVTNAYIWGYNNTYPVAEVVNAKSNEILFDGFEEAGSWDGGVPYFSPTSILVYDNTQVHSGKYGGKIIKTTPGEYYTHSNNWLNISLATPTKFKYSGWVYSDGPTAEIFLFMKTATEPGYFTLINTLTVSQINKWVYVEGEYTVPTSITKLNIRIDNNGGGTVWFDDIRLHPSAAMMNTYTYSPLTGMTSQCDPQNRISYYEYDNIGRLQLIRDQDKNIIKTFEYKYKTPTP